MSRQNIIWTHKTPVVKDIPFKVITAINLRAVPFMYNWYSNLEKNIRYVGFQIPTVAFLNSPNTYELLNHPYCIQEANKTGRDSIQAFVIEEFTDEAALQIIFKSHPAHLHFKDWTYTQKIRLIKICDKYIQEHSRQGKRTDLMDVSTYAQNDDDNLQDDLTCAQSEATPKLADKSNRPYIRNVIAEQLGISASAFKRYRQITKLDDGALDVLAMGVDDGWVDSTAVHRVAQLNQCERAVIIDLMKSDAEIKIKDRSLKLIYDKSRVAKNDLSAEMIKKMLLES